MTNVASTLLDFILDLFRNEESAAAFNEDPQAALTAAGLGDVHPTDVHALMPMVADSSPGGYGGGHRYGGGDDHGRNHYGRDDHGKGDDCEDDHGKDHGKDHHDRPVKDDDCDEEDGHWHKVWHDDKDDCDDDKRDHDGRPNHDYAGHGQEAAVIHNVRYVENNYSYTDVDIENAIWARGDVQAIFGDDNVAATGGSVAAGDDVEGLRIDNSETDVDVDLRDSFNTNSGNENTNIADRGGEITDVDVDDVTVVNDSFNDATIAGRDVDQSTNVEIDDSLNGNTLAGGDVNETNVEIDDSLNGNQIAGDDVNNTEIDDSLVFDHSLNGNNVAGDDVNEFEDSLVVNESLNNNDVAGDDLDQSEDFASDNEILSDNFSGNEVPELVQ